MIFSKAVGAPFPQRDSKTAQRHFFEDGPPSLGPVKWGLQRQAVTTPWGANTHSLHTATRWRQDTHAAYPLPGPLPSPTLGELPAVDTPSVEPVVARLEDGLVQHTLRAVASWCDVEVTALARALHQFDPKAELRAAFRSGGQAARPAGSSARTLQRAAFGVLMELAASRPGLAALKRHVPALAAMSERDEARWVVLIQAARAIEGDEAVGFAPERLVQRAVAGSGIAHQAVTSIVARWSGDQPTAAAGAWAVNAIRNGLFDDGPGSRFDQLDQRLRKLGVWLRRAERDAWWKRLLPWRKKSPFRSMRFGVMGVDRTDVKIHEADYAKHMLQASEWLARRVVAQQQQAKARGPRALAEHLFLSAALEQLAAPLRDFKPGQRVPAFKLDRALAAAIEARAAQHLAPADHAAALGRRLLPDLVNRPLDPQWLLRVARHLSLQGAWPESERRAFHACIQSAKTALYGRKHAVRKINARVLEQVLHHVVDHIQGASRMKWHSGGTAGVGTRGVTGAISAFASSFLLRGRVDARHTRTRAAVFELAMPPYNMELIIGSQTLDASAIGAGVFAGPQLPMSALTAGADVTAWSREASGIDGLCLRLPRVRGHEERLRKRFKYLVSDLLYHAAEPRERGAILRDLLARYPDLTVNQIGTMTDHRRRHGATAEFAAAVDVNMLRVLASAQAGVEYQSRMQRRYQDASGALKVKREVSGKMLRGFVGAGVTARPVLSESGAQIGAGTAELIGVQADFASAGRTLRRDEVTTQGQYSTVSFFEVEHQNLDDFVGSVMGNLETWVASRAQRNNIDPTQARDEIVGFLNQVRQHERVQHTFAQRYELKADHARWIGALQTTADTLLRTNPQNGALKARKYRALARSVLDDVNAYEPASFRIYERSDVTARTGLNLVAQLVAHDYAEGVYAHSRLM